MLEFVTAVVCEAITFWGPFTVFRLLPALSLVTLKMEAEVSCTGARIQKTITWAVRSFRYVQHKWVIMTWRVLRLRMEERPPIWRVAANILNKQSRTAERGGLPVLGLGEVLTTPHRKKSIVNEIFHTKTLVDAVMNIVVPWNAWNFLTSCKPFSFSRRTLHHGVSK